MLYNKITLAFPENQEKLFLRKYFFDSLNQFRVAFILVIILYGLFGYLDSFMFQEYAKLFHIIRFLFVIPILLVVLLLSFTKIFQKIWQALLFISFIVSGTGIIIMTLLVTENYSYYSGMMLIFFAGYFFIKLRFFLATIAGWLTLLIFNLGAIFYSHTSIIILINTNFFFISANLIGMFAAYNIEYYARRNFFLNYELDNEKLHIEAINDNLEKTVQERTNELQIAKEKAVESERLKSAFLANMSHEIRTPMNGILGFTQLLKEPDITGEEQQEFINTIEKSGERMLNTINDIVDFSKIESGLMMVDIKESDINEQNEFIYKFFKPEVERKGIRFLNKNGLQSKEAIIKTDSEKVYAILTNLIKNAIKFTYDGTIEFGYEKKGEYLEFFVKDTGVGIPQKHKEIIFERFRQANESFDRLHEGSGLGLAIAKSYVEMLGGRMWVESEDRKGSIFYFTIPYNPVSKEITIIKDSIPSEHVDVQKKLKILVAEDDVTSFTLLDLILKKISTEVIHTKTGIEAVVACRSNPDIDLVLMDIKMPDMDGYEATRQIRMFNNDIVIIAQTAYVLSDDYEKALDAGCNDYISKPVNMTLLIELIKKHIAKSG